MKLFRQIILGSLFICLPLVAKTYYTSQTFLQPRPLYHNQAGLNLWSHIRAVKDADSTSAFLCYGSYMDSNEPDTEKNIRSYFLLNNQPKILVTGDNSEQKTHRNVRAEWLGLPSDFKGTMTLCPHQQQAGFMLAYNKDLKDWVSWEALDYWWLEFQLPFTYVQTNLGFKELSQTPVPSTWPGPQSLAQAFDQSSWDFAKMDCKNRSETGFAELRIIAGGTYIGKNDFLVAYTGSFSIPMFSRNSPTHLFTPIIGGNGHAEIGLELNFELPLQPIESTNALLLFLNIQDHYYLPRTQTRTFDLYKKPWSRYLLLRRKDEEATTPAVNIFTHQVRVRPFNTVDLSTGFRAVFENTSIELGYNLWGHSEQHLQFTEPYFSKTPALITYYGIAGTGTNSASKSTICTQAANDVTFKYLSLADLDLSSGASQKGFTSKIHACCSIHAFECGFFYEFPHTNTSLEEWGVWAAFTHLF